MAYVPFSRRAAVLMWAPWYEVQALLRELNSLRKINFAIVEQRQQALNRLNNLPCDAPFTRTIRFPGDKLYVCEMYADWSRKFQQLKSALSFKERDLRTQVNTTGAKEEGHGSISDAQQAFWNATTAMYDEVSRIDGVFDQDSFELIYELVWVQAG